jgi:hypothetical protein
MNLGKLLAAGKSVKSGREAASYRANKQVYLPKFGSAKNPFKPEATQVAAETTGNAEAQSLNAVDSHPLPVEGDKSATARLDLAASQEAAARSVHIAPAPNIQKQPVAFAGQGKKTADWVSKFNPASLFRASSKVETKSSSATARAAKTTATQTELSLDSVKVVHNDLSDADVEIVPMKSRSSVPDIQPPKKSWEFLGERLFGVETT